MIFKRGFAAGGSCEEFTGAVAQREEGRLLAADAAGRERGGKARMKLRGSCQQERQLLLRPRAPSRYWSELFTEFTLVSIEAKWL